MTFEDEEIPLGPPGLSGSYEAGYGITWTRGSEGDDLTRLQITIKQQNRSYR